MHGPSFLSPPFPYPGGYYAPMAVFGADAPAPTTQPGMLDKFKTAMAAQNSVIPVKNGYLLAAGVVGGIAVIGSAEGWWGKKHHAGGDYRRRHHHRRHY